MLVVVVVVVITLARLVVQAALAVVVMEALTTQERVLMDRQTLVVAAVQIPLIMTILESPAALAL
jgi:hypothetical protein